MHHLKHGISANRQPSELEYLNLESGSGWRSINSNQSGNQSTIHPSLHQSIHQSSGFSDGPWQGGVVAELYRVVLSCVELCC
jgi:hypothetical protein